MDFMEFGVDFEDKNEGARGRGVQVRVREKNESFLVIFDE